MKKFTALLALLFLIIPVALTGCDNDTDPYAYMFDEIVVGNESTDGTDYLGHPDSLLLDNGDILTAFPLGHGKGETVIKISRDKGLTWHSVFDDTNEKPESFADTWETPTLYKLNFTDGSQKLICVSGRPSWPITSLPWHMQGEGFDVSVSESSDEGETFCNGLVWSEHENFFGPFAKRSKYYREAEECDPVVAMSSLTQLKDGEGNFIDAWMGTFHDDRGFTVYKTILTFGENGEMEWTEPVRLLGSDNEYRDLEKSKKFCETEIVRSPNGAELAAIFRTNTRRDYSYVAFSADEGATWSQPRPLSAELSGERHKAEYDPASGKLLVTFRSTAFDEISSAYYSRGWLMWVGDYEDLKEGENAHGDFVIKLAHTYMSSQAAPDEKADSDTGYAGLVIYDDGLVVTTSYGKFSPPSVSDNTYIITKRFKLSDIEAYFGSVGGKTVNLFRT